MCRICYNLTRSAHFQSSASKALVIDKDVTGYTPVHYAARAGYLQVKQNPTLNNPRALIRSPARFFKQPGVQRRVGYKLIYDNN